MRDDELQVLGKSRKLIRREKWTIAVCAIVIIGIVVALGIWGHNLFANEQDVQVRKTPGEPTIVPELQECVDSLLTSWLDSINGMQGQVIVMEVQSGEIVAMVGRERNFEGKFQPCKNFAYQQELGSLTKTASLLAALETGEVKMSDVVDVGAGIWDIDGEHMMLDHNWRRGGYGQITLDYALAVSSNIGISKTVRNVYKGHELDFFLKLDSMSFGYPNNIAGIDGLKPTSYNSPRDSDWANWMLCWSAIGYERKIAPIQMLTFYNAIANDGKMMKPTLKTGDVEVINPQIASAKNIKLMQGALEHVVSQGLGRKAGTPLILVAGKTGTSQVGEYYQGEESVSEYQLAFCGYFPADAPKYSMIVSMNKIGLPASGGGMSGALFHDIVEQMIAHGMPTVFVVDDEKKDTVMITPDNIRSLTDSLSRRDDGYRIHLGVPAE